MNLGTRWGARRVYISMFITYRKGVKGNPFGFILLQKTNLQSPKHIASGYFSPYMLSAFGDSLKEHIPLNNQELKNKWKVIYGKEYANWRKEHPIPYNSTGEKSK